MPVYWETFKTWRNGAKIFIESGTFQGDGVKKSLEAGFKEVYTIEINAVDRQIAIDRFANEPELIKLTKGKKINFILGDSSIELENILKNIDSKACIWLDAHFGAVNEYNFDHLPLAKELAIIKKYSDKVETIWIDDIRLLKGDGEGQLPWTRQELINMLKEINSNFEITYDNGFVENDILVAFNGK